MAHVKVKIKNSKVTISVDGAPGSSCQDLTRSLEEKLGTVTRTEPTEEMYGDTQQIQDQDQ